MSTPAPPGSMWSGFRQIYVSMQDRTLHAFGFTTSGVPQPVGSADEPGAQAAVGKEVGHGFHYAADNGRRSGGHCIVGPAKRGSPRELFAPVPSDGPLSDDTRTVRFANSMVVRERIIDVDDAERRVASPS